jgi:hypothetical protein
LAGAYGLSDGVDHTRNIPAMLEALATGTDIEAASWGDAYDDALLSYVWHQYSIYPVTPPVVGFVVRIASLRLENAPSLALQLALAVRLIAEATKWYRQSEEPEKRAIGEATTTALLCCRSELRQWLATSLSECALAAGQFVPELDLDGIASAERS